jgi:peptidyl-tRNA hydrolase, PTH1 family
VSLLRRSRESSFAYLVVGLGNPGPRYRDTRHNLGRKAVERVAEQLGGSWRSRWSGLSSEVRDGDKRLVLLVPETFMNDSGRSVAPALRFTKLPAERLVVVHDELDLPFGAIRLKLGGGDNGHNGLKSLRRSLGSGEFHRVRLGIGRPPGRQDPADWVLRDWSAAERKDIDLHLERAADAVETLIADGLTAAQNTYND